MNREILFRGKRVDNGEWVYGGFVGSKYICTYLGQVPDILCNPIRFFPIGTLTLCEVIPETVGQFTGLMDKNGTKIFEGDIIKSKDWNPMEYKVIFEEGEFCFVSLYGVENPFTNSIHYARSFQITANIHDNHTP